MYHLCLRYVGRHEDASELAQDVFVRAFKGLVFTYSDTVCGPGPQPTSGTIFGQIGTPLTVEALLDALGRGGTHTGFADASDTFQFFLDPEADVTYTTASGNTFFTPAGPAAVPEPLH